MIDTTKVALFCIRSELITSVMLKSLSVECGAMRQPSTDVSLKCKYIFATWKLQKDHNLHPSEQLLHICRVLCPGQGPENGSNKLLLIIHFFLSTVFLVHKLGRRKEYSWLVYSHLFQLSSNYAYIYILPYHHAAYFLPPPLSPHILEYNIYMIF